MLIHLSIENFAIIEKCDLDWSTGMTIITGETGAGKSIILEALGLALGVRADSQSVRTGASKADIQAIFDLSLHPLLQQWLSEKQLNRDCGECFLRRIISADGGSRSYINQHLVPLQLLRELGSSLVTLHGQHEHQGLLSRETQREWLDIYSHHENYLTQVNTLYYSYNTAEKKLKEQQQKIQHRETRIAFLQYQLAEFSVGDIALLTPEKILQLEQKHKNFSQAKTNLNAYQSVILLLEENILTDLYKAVQLLPKENKFSAYFDQANIQLSEALHDLQAYLVSLEMCPEKLCEIENTLTLLYTLARKHHVRIEELPALYQTLQAEVFALEKLSDNIFIMENNLAKLKKDYLDISQQLSDSRKINAKKMAAEIQVFLQDLSMENAKFSVSLISLETGQISPYGLEKVEFLVSPNLGQTLQPLAKIASGGELSRMSLAIDLIASRDQRLPALIFDEVDVGISGATAMKVGKLLKKLSINAQIICITHLAQVASQGDHYLQVEKNTNNRKNSTTAHIYYLDKTQKIQAIARLLGGSQITEKALLHAQELLDS